MLNLWHRCSIKKPPWVQPEGFQASQAVVTPNQVKSDDLVIAAAPGLDLVDPVKCLQQWPPSSAADPRKGKNEPIRGTAVAPGAPVHIGLGDPELHEGLKGYGSVSMLSEM